MPNDEMDMANINIRMALHIAAAGTVVSPADFLRRRGLRNAVATLLIDS